MSTGPIVCSLKETLKVDQRYKGAAARKKADRALEKGNKCDFPQ